MQNQIDITVFVPCKNEEENIIATLNNVVEAFQSFNYTYEILIYDDDSTDKSKELIKYFINQYQELDIILIQNQKALGFISNYINASILGKGKYIKLVAGCNYEPKEAIELIIKYLGTVDLVLLYYDDKRGFLRENISALYTKIVNLLSGYSLRHYHGVSLVLREDILRYHPYNTSYGFFAEFVTILLNERKTFKEVFVPWNNPIGHNSNSLGFKQFISVLHSMLNILLNRGDKILSQIIEKHNRK